MSPSQPTSPSSTPPPRPARVATGALAGLGAALLLGALSPVGASVGSALSLSGATSPTGSTVAPAAAQGIAPARTTTYAAPSRPAAVRAAGTAAAVSRQQSARAATGRCTGAQVAADAFMAHFDAAHLEASPSEQVADVLDVDQYTKTHTVLVEHMVKPMVAGAGGARDAFLQHFYAAHLEESPSQQAADAAAVDQYTVTHTVLAEHMVAPVAGSC
jgi:hypothetical protein